jgi:hypothetical protein
MCLEDRPTLEQNAAGIDIGSCEIFVAVPPDRDPNPVRVFPTFTENLQELAAWLLQCGVTTAAMESTGVPCRLNLVREPTKPSPLRLLMDLGRAPIRILFRQAPD